LGTSIFAHLPELGSEGEPTRFGKRTIQGAGSAKKNSESKEPESIFVGKTPGSLELGLSVALVMDFHAFGEEAFAALTATTIENGASVFGFHPGTKTKLTFTSAFGGLIGWFHDRDAFLSLRIKVGCEVKRRNRGVKQGIWENQLRGCSGGGVFRFSKQINSAGWR